MKKIATLLLMLTLLAACAAPVVDELTTESITTTELTTEAFIIAVEVDEDDPFSFVLRAYAEFAQWNMQARHLHHEEWPAAFAQWKQDTQSLLSRFTMLHSMDTVWEVAASESMWDTHMEYALHDISGNGEYDLLMRFVARAGWHVLFDIYSIVDDVPVQQMQKCASRRVSMSVYSSGVVTRSGGGMGNFWMEIHRFVDGQLRFSSELASSHVHVNCSYYRVSGEPRDGVARTVTPISEQEYNRIKAQYGIGQTLELNWRPLFVPAQR